MGQHKLTKALKRYRFDKDMNMETTKSIYKHLTQDTLQSAWKFHTPTQHQYINNGLTGKMLKTLLNTMIPTSQKDTLWRFFCKILPLYHPEKNSKPYLESSVGIFFDSPIARFLENKITTATSKGFIWSTTIFKCVHPTLPGIIPPMFKTLWWFRNQTKHNLTPRNYEAWVMLRSELSKLINKTRGLDIYDKLFNLKPDVLLNKFYQ
jgi:hypothetical protein